MNIKKKIHFFTILLIAYACNSGVKIKEQKIKSDIEKNSGIVIADFKFKEEFTTDFAIGDYTESFIIQFDSLAFKDIISQIKKSKYYDSTFHYNSSHVTLSNITISKRWIEMPFGYKFEFFINENEWLEYEVGMLDHTISYLYVQE